MLLLILIISLWTGCIVPYNLLPHGGSWHSFFFCIKLCDGCLAKVYYPSFNKLTPLEDGELKIRLMNSEKVGFHAQSIEVIDGSKRSSFNAYLPDLEVFEELFCMI